MTRTDHPNTYDTLTTEYNFKDYEFSRLRERYRSETGNSWKEELFDSFGIRDADGKLTNAGALLADYSPIVQSRIICNRWNEFGDASDSTEYSGSLITLFEEGYSFLRRNMRTPWIKAPNSRIELPEYPITSISEALVNALIHRDYQILDSRILVDIYDDHLTITSPGGMPDGTYIQERDISKVSIVCRNPILANILEHLGYMVPGENGLKRILESYRSALNYRKELTPKFHSDSSTFQVMLYNLNYGMDLEEMARNILDEARKRSI